MVGVGAVLVLAERLPVKLGRLPGDFVFHGKNTTIYLPLATSVLLSTLLSVALWVFRRFR